MNNSNIHKSLVELENSLVQLKSANSQVTSLATKSEKVTESVQLILKSLTGINDDINNELEKFVSDLDRHNSDLKTQISEFNSSSKESIEYVQNSFKDLTHVIQTRVNEARTAFEDFTEEVNRAQKKISEFDFKSELTALKVELEKTKEQIQNELKAYSDSNNSQIKSARDDLANTIDLNNKSTLEKFSNQINKLEASLHSKQQRNLYVILTGGILLAILNATAIYILR